MSIELDYLLWAAYDLDRGSALLAKVTGVTPAIGGSHPGFGTRNSLLSLGDTYLEVISPDPAQSLEGNRGGLIASLAAPGLMTFAVRTTSLAAYEASAKRAGIVTRGPVKMGRTRPDGLRLDWECLYVEDHVFGEAIPFAIDWKGSPHPSHSAPAGCRLVDLQVLLPGDASRGLPGIGDRGSGQAVAGWASSPSSTPRSGRAQLIQSARQLNRRSHS